MPELPEVETIVRDLGALLPGAVVESVHVIHPDLIEGETAEEFERALEGRTIHAVARRAKNILLDLGDELLVVNLGMTGRLLARSAGDEEPSHPGVRFTLGNGRRLDYHDIRRFGRLQRFTPAAWADRDRDLGVEPLSDEFTAAHLHERTRASRVAIKVWLMDQRRVVGVGNIYASEALFRARIDPRRPAKSLEPEESSRIRDSTRAVLDEAIRFRGTTFLDYRDARGERGDFARRLAVYDREGLPCATCRAPIQRIVQAGRSTFFCEGCQN